METLAHFATKLLCKTRTLYLLSLDPSAPPFFLRLAASETKRSEGRKRKINKKGIGVRDRVSCARVASRGGDLRACVRGEGRRRTGARGGDAAAAAANGARSRDAPRARTRLFACLQIIIIRPPGGAASTPRPATRATGYAQLSLHLAGFDSEFAQSFDLFTWSFRVGVLSIGTSLVPRCRCVTPTYNNSWCI